MSNVFTMGIDVGSTASKCIILKDGKEIVAKICYISRDQGLVDQLELLKKL